MHSEALFAALFCSLLTLGGVAAEHTNPAAQPQGRLLVVNKGNHTLGIIDPVGRKQVASIDVEEITGHEVAASPDGRRAFVPIFGSGGVGSPGTDGRFIRVIDLMEKRIIASVDLGRGLRPHEAVFGPQDGLLYVTTEIDNSISVIDPDNLKVVGRIPTGQEHSHMLALTRDGRLAVTANVGPGSVSVLDVKARKELAVIPVADAVQRISISMDDRWVFTSDQRKPRLAVIDLEGRKLHRWADLPGTGYGSAPTPDGRFLLVALPRLGQVAFLDLQDMKVTETVQVPRAPQEILVRPDGAVAYISCDASGQVAELDLAKRKVAALIEAGPGADGLAWAPGN